MVMTGERNRGAEGHWRALERLYSSAPVNSKFASSLEVTGEGSARITFDITGDVFHAAGAAHGTVYFKMLDDAAFYAANTLVTDRFADHGPTAFHQTSDGTIVAEGRWVMEDDVFVADHLVDAGERD